MPFAPGTPKPPGSGRKRGTKNRVTTEVRELARGLVGSPEYLERLRQRLLDGTAGTVEQLVWRYAWGNPPELEPQAVRVVVAYEAEPDGYGDPSTSSSGTTGSAE